jgi:CheY-like chemotaxis protein
MYPRHTDPNAPAILLVEDCDTDAYLIEQAFRKAGIANRFVRVCGASAALTHLNGAALGARAKGLVFVLLDLKMPDESGYEVLRWIRNHTEYHALPVVIVTGSEFPEEEAKSRQAGATAFYRKHLSFDSLVQLVCSTGAFWSLVPGREASSTFKAN